MRAKRVARTDQRLLERLFRLLGVPHRAQLAPPPFMETLEPRTLMSIAAITNPFQANTGDSQVNILPRVAASSGGNYVVVWATGTAGEIRFRLFDAAGEDLTDDTGTGDFLAGVPSGGLGNQSSGTPAVSRLTQSQFDVAMDSSGDFVIVWQDSEDILAQKFDSAGNPNGDIINVTESGTDLTNETTPSIAMDDNGDFAVTWLLDASVDVNTKTMTPKTYYDYFDTNSYTVKRNTTNASTDLVTTSYTTSLVQARRFDSTGAAGDVINVTPLPASAATTQTQSFTTNLNPGIAMDSAGDFTVVWNAIGYAPQKVQTDPKSQYSYTQDVTDSHGNPKTVTLHRYTAAAFSYYMGNSGVKAFAQRFNANSSAQGAAITALTRTPSASTGQIIGTDVKIAMDSAGDFAIVGNTQYQKTGTVTNNGYTYSYYGTSSVISTRRYTAAGTAVGSETTIASAPLTPFFSPSPLDPSAAQITGLATTMDASGNLLVAWDAGAFDTDSVAVISTGIFERRYNSAGVAQEAAPSQVTFGAGATSTGGPQTPAVAFGAAGIIDFAWEQDGASTQDIFTALYRQVLPPSKVAFDLQPVDSDAGLLDEIDVVVQDSTGFLVADGSSTVTLSIFSGPTGAKLLGTLSVPTMNGVAAFTNVSIPRGGNYVLKATDGALTSATSSSFLITTQPAQLAFTTQPANGTAGHALSTIVVNVRDANGDLSVADNSTVTLAIATGPNGAGDLTGEVSVDAVNGIATFTGLSLPTSGTYTLLASDGDLANATSSKFIITAGAGTNFTFSTQPEDTIAGNKFTVKVTLTDDGGNLATLDHSKITLAFGDHPFGGTLTGAAQATVTNGVATFTNLTLPIAGDYTLVAIDDAIAVATSNTFTVIAAAPAKIIFDIQPGLTVAGHAIDSPIEVDIVDKFGNIVSNGSDVTLSVLSGPTGFAPAGGTLVQTTVDGVATFDDITLTRAGAYTLKAVMGKLSVTSAKFVVTADEVSQLIILTQPKPAVAGVALKPITVALEDQFGNIATTNTSVVTMAIDSGPDDAAIFGNASASAVKGIVTFNNLVLHTAGTYTLAAAQDGATSGITNPFLISPAAGATLQFLQNPSDVVAGHTMSTPTSVQILDAFGNLATGDKSTVTLKIASGPAGAKLFGKFAVAAVNGVATFGALALQTAGAYTLAATDGKMVGDTSGSFTVTASVAAKLTFTTVPATIPAGSPFAVQVKLLDAFGNVAAGDSSNVTLSLATKPVGGTLGGTLTLAADHGVVNFSALTLSPKGKYTLKATDANPLTPITSSLITVTVGVV